MSAILDTVTVRAISVAEARTLWPVLAPLFDAALSKAQGEMNLHDVQDMIQGGGGLVLVATPLKALEAPVGAFLVRVVDYPKARAVRVILGAGEPMEAWLPALLHYLDGYAPYVGADRLEIFGRPGFERAFKGVAEKAYSVMVRRLR